MGFTPAPYKKYSHSMQWRSCLGYRYIEMQSKSIQPHTPIKQHRTSHKHMSSAGHHSGWIHRLKPLASAPSSPTGTSSCPNCSTSIQLPTCGLSKQQRDGPNPRALAPMCGTQRKFLAYAFNQLSSSHCRHLGSRLVYRRPPCLSSVLSLPYKNKTNLKIK